MQFNDSSTNQGLIQEYESQLGLNYGDVSGVTVKLQEATRLINRYVHRAVGIILRAQDEWDYDDINHSDYPILTTDLVASQQDYTLPASEKILKIKRVEINYGSQWVKTEPFDINERGKATDTSSLSDFSTTEPFYDMQHNAIFLYPIPTSNVTGGLKIWITREPTEFATSDTTKEPGIDEEFHSMLAIGAAADFLEALGSPRAVAKRNLYTQYEQRLALHYGKKQDDRQIVIKSAYTDYR